MRKTLNSYIEEAKSLPEISGYDVIVCGAGPAGVSAAISSARSGSRTLLLESAGCLGGVWTSGMLAWIIDADSKGGLMYELLETLQASSQHMKMQRSVNGVAFDVEKMKQVLEEMVLAAGVDVQLHTRVVAANIERGRLSHVITESKSGRQAWSADCFVDCTGDGDLAALAGCEYDLGKPETGECQPMGMVAMVTGLDPERVRPFMGGGLIDPKGRLYREFLRAGMSPSYSQPILLHLFDQVFILIANHEYGYSALSSEDVTMATFKARAEINKLVDALRSLGGEWADIRLIQTAGQIGVREGRRIHGHYRVTEDDLIHGRAHDDGVCRVTFGVDVHNTDPAEGTAMEEVKTHARPYDIPLRSLIARDIKGLLMAGRCVSGDFIAHSSYRVTGNAVPMGEAAGALAAMASRNRKSPEEIPYQWVLEKIQYAIGDMCL